MVMSADLESYPFLEFIFPLAVGMPDELPPVGAEVGGAEGEHGVEKEDQAAAGEEEGIKKKKKKKKKKGGGGGGGGEGGGELADPYFLHPLSNPTGEFCGGFYYSILQVLIFNFFSFT